MTARPIKPALVRFYFDADVLGLAKVIDKLRADITYPGDAGGRSAQAAARGVSDHDGLA